MEIENYIQELKIDRPKKELFKLLLLLSLLLMGVVLSKII